MLISRFTYCLYLLGLLYMFNIPTVHQNKYGHKFNFHQTKSMQKYINISIYYMLHGWLMVSHPVSSLGAPRGVFSDLPVTLHAALQQRGATFAAITAVFKKNRRWCLATAGCGGSTGSRCPPLHAKNRLNSGNLVQ
jgi:hypothetical protein